MTGYVSADGELEPATLDPAEFDAIRERLFGVGGRCSTVTDLASLLQCLLDGGVLDDERLLKASTVESMCGPQPPGRMVEGHDVHCGYGWIVEDLPGEKLVQHGGSVPGFQGFVGVLRERELGVALGVNQSGLPEGEIGKGILALACGETPHGAVRWFRAKRMVEAVTGPTGPTARRRRSRSPRRGGRPEFARVDDRGDRRGGGPAVPRSPRGGALRRARVRRADGRRARVDGRVRRDRRGHGATLVPGTADDPVRRTVNGALAPGRPAPGGRQRHAGPLAG